MTSEIKIVLSFNCCKSLIEWKYVHLKFACVFVNSGAIKNSSDDVQQKFSAICS